MKQPWIKDIQKYKKYLTRKEYDTLFWFNKQTSKDTINYLSKPVPSNYDASKACFTCLTIGDASTDSHTEAYWSPNWKCFIYNFYYKISDNVKLIISFTAKELAKHHLEDVSCKLNIKDIDIELSTKKLPLLE
jgi:hypothetical protein